MNPARSLCAQVRRELNDGFTPDNACPCLHKSFISPKIPFLTHVDDISSVYMLIEVVAKSLNKTEFAKAFKSFVAGKTSRRLRRLPETFAVLSIANDNPELQSSVKTYIESVDLPYDNTLDECLPSLSDAYRTCAELVVTMRTSGHKTTLTSLCAFGLYREQIVCNARCDRKKMAARVDQERCLLEKEKLALKSLTCECVPTDGPFLRKRVQRNDSRRDDKRRANSPAYSPLRSKRSRERTIENEKKTERSRKR